MKKYVAYASVLLGAALLVFAIALPTYVVPKGRILPLNVVSTTGTEPTPGNLLDAAALAQNRPVAGNESRPECQGEHPQIGCFIHKGLKMQSQRFTTAQEPSNKKEVTLEVGQSFFRTDLKEPRNLLSASVDRVTLDRKTQMPVPDPVSTVDITAPALKGGKAEASVAPFTRSGITYQFPMGTDRKSYDYFDMHLLKSQPIDFVDEEEVNGQKVYAFHQTVKPTELYPALRERLEADGELNRADEAALASLRLKFPAKVWGLDAPAPDAAPAPEAPPAEGEHPSAEPHPAPAPEGSKPEDKPADKPADLGPEVELSRYYTVDRKLWVEPETGVIVNGQETVFQYYAQDQADADRIFENKDQEIQHPTRTATYFEGKWDQASQDSQMAKAKEGVNRAKLMGSILPWVSGVLGVLLLGAGFVLARRRG